MLHKYMDLVENRSKPCALGATTMPHEQVSVGQGALRATIAGGQFRQHTAGGSMSWRLCWKSWRTIQLRPSRIDCRLLPVECFIDPKSPADHCGSGAVPQQYFYRYTVSDFKPSSGNVTRALQKAKISVILLIVFTRADDSHVLHQDSI